MTFHQVLHIEGEQIIQHSLETGEMLMIALKTVLDLVNEHNGESWDERVFPLTQFPFLFNVPSNWSLEKKTCEVMLDGTEPS